MARLSMPDTPVDGSNIYRLLNNSLCSSVASSADPGSEDYLGGVTSETSGKSNGGLEVGTDLFASSVTKGVTDRGWVASPGATTKNKVKTTGATTQAPPSNHYEQQYPYGYQVPGYPQGMMPVDPGMAPPGMMPMQPGTLPPGMMPYMMPPPYYGCSPFRETCYDYTCGHPEIKTVTVGSRARSDFSYSTSDSSCITLFCAEPCEGLAKLVLKTVGSIQRSATNVMDYGEDLCDPVGSGSNSVRTRRNSSTIADSAELLEKIDKLYKLVTKNEATPIQKVNDCNCIDSSILAYEMDNVPREAETRAKKGGDIVKECASENVLEKKPQIKVKLSQMENALNESIEAEADFQDAKKMQSHLLVKRVPLKSFQVKGENASSKKAPVIDSMGFPLASSSKNLSNPLSWESDFSSSNPFAAEVDSCVRSPVSVITSLEARSCAWCGLGESNAKNVKKLKLCSACQTTYYCSSECQSKDWSHGHSEKCQAMSR